MRIVIMRIISGCELTGLRQCPLTFVYLYGGCRLDFIRWDPSRVRSALDYGDASIYSHHQTRSEGAAHQKWLWRIHKVVVWS